jgi:hypothetical protein
MEPPSQQAKLKLPVRADSGTVPNVSVSAVSTSQRVHTRQLASFIVPANGTTTSFTFVGHL